MDDKDYLYKEYFDLSQQLINMRKSDIVYDLILYEELENRFFEVANKIKEMEETLIG